MKLTIVCLLTFVLLSKALSFQPVLCVLVLPMDISILADRPLRSVVNQCKFFFVI